MKDRARVLCVFLVLGTLCASSQPVTKSPFPTGWVDTSAVDKKDFVPAGSNVYFRLEPGYRLKPEGHEGLRRVTLIITVLEETRLVDGGETRIVEERELKGGRLAEISRNFFAFNTADRGVYYFGEEVDIYKNGEIVDHEGAWESGKGGARFGLMMPDRPRVGARFYQEIAPGVAMDRAEIVSLDASLRTPGGAFNECLRVAETNPLEGGAREFKIYAPGVGLVKDGPLVLVEFGRERDR
jgi:hypothetical protein